MDLGDVVAVVRARTLVHEDALEVVPNFWVDAKVVGREELAHVELERVRDGEVGLASGEVLHVEHEAEQREVQDLVQINTQSTLQAEDMGRSAREGECSGGRIESRLAACCSCCRST